MKILKGTVVSLCAVCVGGEARDLAGSASRPGHRNADRQPWREAVVNASWSLLIVKYND